MKVIIELNGYVSIRNTDDDSIVKISICLGEGTVDGLVNIDDLKLALRKMTAK